LRDVLPGELPVLGGPPPELPDRGSLVRLEPPGWQEKDP